MTTTSFCLSDSLYLAIRTLAHAEQRSMGFIIRRLVKQALERES